MGKRSWAGAGGLAVQDESQLGPLSAGRLCQFQQELTILFSSWNTWLRRCGNRGPVPKLVQFSNLWQWPESAPKPGTVTVSNPCTVTWWSYQTWWSDLVQWFGTILYWAEWFGTIFHWAEWFGTIPYLARTFGTVSYTSSSDPIQFPNPSMVIRCSGLLQWPHAVT